MPKINFWKSYMSRLQFRLVEETEHPERNLIVKGILDIIFDNISLFRIFYLRCLSGTDIKIAGTFPQFSAKVAEVYPQSDYYFMIVIL